jgi:hypothetical protein
MGRLTGTVVDLETKSAAVQRYGGQQRSLERLRAGARERIVRTEDVTDQVGAMQAANGQLTMAGKDDGGAPELAGALKVGQTDARRRTRTNEVLAEQVRELAKKKDVEGEGIDADAALARIEAAVGRFEMEQPVKRRDGTLEAVLTALYQILEVFEEQKQKQKQKLMWIEGSLPRKMQRSR